MYGTVDRVTAEHFYAWLAQYVHESEQSDVEDSIHALLRDDPSYLKTHSWPEMRILAEAR